jgi:hypothetical protein
MEDQMVEAAIDVAPRRCNVIVGIRRDAGRCLMLSEPTTLPFCSAI